MFKDIGYSKMLWRPHRIIYWTTFVFALCAGLCVAADDIPPQQQQQQKFRVTPHNLQILEGTDTLLRCEITNRAGQVQWTKDGFALGFSAVIHGFPRYSVLVDAANGVYNLQIKNATLEDDAEYQCQVGPAPGNPAIRANARLSVVAAPTSIAFEGYEPNVKVEVVEKQNVTLKCITENANPAASIVWYYGNAPLNDANPVEQTKEVMAKRFRTVSTLMLQPRADDNFKDISCEARHKALPPDVPMRANVQLSVLYPPGPPFLEGYSQGETLRRGQKVQIYCRSRGGNPPAQLIWYKNGVPVSTTQRTSGQLSENAYKFTAKSTDNGVQLTCEAKNILSSNPLRTQVNLTVLFSPANVSITGPTEAKVGEDIKLHCVTEPSNPPARISWSLNGRPLEKIDYKTSKSVLGGWISTSNVSLNIDAQSRTFVAVCHAFNTELTQNVVSTHTVNILYPPSAPLLTGYNEGDVLASGLVKKLQCASIGGNPPPSLLWYKNDKKLNAAVKVNDNKVSSELSILVNASDNNAIYKCEVKNAAIEIPLFATKTFSVHFPPETIKISVEPKNLIPGINAKLICDSSSSNPPAKVSWWRDGIPVEGINFSMKPGLWGGTVSTLEMHINVTQDLDGSSYTCQSINEALQRSVHETLILDVLFPPAFDAEQKTKFTGIEGEFISIGMLATGKPMPLSFTWTREGFPLSARGQRILTEANMLNITNLSRSDAGMYICEAMNSQGTAMIELHLIVEYPPTIVTVTENLSFAPGEDATLACTVDAHPLEAEHIHWSRHGYDMKQKTTTSFVNNTAYLTIANITRADMGNFTCTADNQRGAVAHQMVTLVMQTAPEIDKSPAFTRFAGRLSERSHLVCRSFAAPEPNFIWRRNGKDIKMRRNKFRSNERKVDPLTYESLLTIENTQSEDYGQYECVVRNSHGQASSTLEFSKPTRPDTPLALQVGNVTDDTVTLNWTPGFDGGLTPYYRLRYKQTGEQKYKFLDAKAGQTNITVGGLHTGETYLFSIMAVNEAGSSKYMPDSKIVLTKGAKPYSAEYIEKNEMPNLMVIGITSAAMVLLILNAALVAWFFIRRQNKSSANTENTNEEAYSKDDNQSVYKLPITALQADVHKKAASTYLVESVDIIQSTSYPPKYQESSLSMPPYMCNPDFTRTLPNPRRQSNHNVGTELTVRAKDDHMLIPNGLYIPSPSPASSLVIKGSYISSPSPAPPPDGSYFNMSDKYISYPPVTY